MHVKPYDTHTVPYGQQGRCIFKEHILHKSAQRYKKVSEVQTRRSLLVKSDMDGRTHIKSSLSECISNDEFCKHKANSKSYPAVEFVIAALWSKAITQLWSNIQIELAIIA